MTDVAAPAAPTTATKKSPKKTAMKTKVAATHPTYSEMICKAVAALKEKKGSSRQAILKYIMSNFKVGNDAKKINAHMKMALKRALKDGTLKQPKGTGITGSFRMGEKKKAKKPKATKKTGEKKTKKTVKKVKKPTTATTEGTTTTAAAEKPKKVAKKSKSPKKATKAKAPRVKKATKSPATKKAAKATKKPMKKSPKKTVKKTPAPTATA